MSQNPFPKYVKVSGVSKLNPEWKRWQNQNGMVTSLSKKEQDNALPVYCSRAEYLQNNPSASNLPNMGFAESYQATCDIIQEDEVVQKVGIQKEQILNVVGELFQKYEIPMGLANKLMELQTFDYLFFMVDDSGSMNNNTDTRDPLNGTFITRWEETRSRLVQLIEILSYVPTPTIIVSFLNRNILLQLVRVKGDNPESFYASCCEKLNSAFMKRPGGTTPYAAKIQQVFSQYAGDKVSWYFFGDGVPDGGVLGIRQIESTVLHRRNPQQNPVAFFSCSDVDEEVEWMKNLEEVAPYCSEFDDYQKEKQEVLLDQGLGLPFTMGFYMIGCLVAAMNPNDLDAMDESVPLTKYALDNLLGFTSSEPDYRHYFDLFIQAQSVRKLEDKTDNVKRSYDWRPMYGQFLQSHLSMEIQGVQHFKRQLQMVSGNGHSIGNNYSSSHSYANFYAPQTGYQGNSLPAPKAHPSSKSHSYHQSKKKGCIIL